MHNRFYNKMIYNLVRAWTAHTHQDSAIEQAMDRHLMYVGNLEDGSENENQWWTIITTRRNEWMATLSPEKAEFASYASFKKYMTIDDMQAAAARMAELFPEVLEPFELLENSVALADLLDLNEHEAVILDLAIRLRQSLPYGYNYVFDKFGHHMDMKDPVQRYNILLGIPSQDMEKIVKGFLFKSGVLIESEGNRLPYVNAELKEALCATSFSIESLEEKLFPSNVESTLGMENYPHLAKEIDRTVRIVNTSLETKNKGTNVMFWGLPGTGKTELALALAKQNDWNLHIVGDISENDDAEKGRAQRLTSLKLALKLFKKDPKAVILFDEMEDLFKVDNNASFSKAFINRIIETTTIPIIWTTNSVTAMGSACLRRMVYNIHFEIPPQEARKGMWARAAAKYNVNLSDELVESFGNSFDIVPALINNSMKISGMAGLEGDDISEVIVSLDRLMNFGETRKFDEVKMKDTPYDVSCANTDLDLNKFTERLMTANPAFSLCLYGAPGTGKSEYGRYLAKRLGKQVLYKRASDLQSMWLGECEKNIAKAFKEAREGKKVLIIDEGDSFLQDRTKARQSWEISQVNEMLSQMENHDQPFIITTNLMDNLDPASLRRFTFKMKFDFMRPEQSAKLFEKYFKLPAPTRIERFDNLAPGDFSTVMKKVTILGVEDPNEILNLIEDELKVKPGYRKSGIGFGN
jgi:SpoVK/Ycf46/Vps4 family AAA+-type ATPase